MTLDWRRTGAWTFATLAVLVLAQSFLESGRGLGGLGIITHIGWSYLFLLLGAGFIIAALAPPAGKAPK